MIFWAFTEKSNFYMGMFRKNQFNIEEGFPKKRGAWTVYKYRGGGGGAVGEKAKFNKGVLLSGGLIPQCTLCII